MFTSEEMETITVAGYEEAVNAVLSKLLVRDGKIDISALKHTDIDHAIHLFRYYRVVSGGNHRSFD